MFKDLEFSRKVNHVTTWELILKGCQKKVKVYENGKLKGTFSFSEAKVITDSSAYNLKRCLKTGEKFGTFSFEEETPVPALVMNGIPFRKDKDAAIHFGITLHVL